MTKRFAGLVIAAVAAGSFALPAAPASAGECISMATTPVQCLLEAAEPAPICIPRGHTPPICLSVGSTG